MAGATDDRDSLRDILMSSFVAWGIMAYDYLPAAARTNAAVENFIFPILIPLKEQKRTMKLVIFAHLATAVSGWVVGPISPTKSMKSTVLYGSIAPKGENRH